MADYMSKYMNKQDRPESLKGKRLWAEIGKWGATRCKDIEVESEFVAAFHARRAVVEAEARVAATQGVKYPREHNLETIAWAEQHVYEVKTDKRVALTGFILDISEASDVARTWKDWDAAFDDLAAARQVPTHFVF
jgi:hypothetical protein